MGGAIGPEAAGATPPRSTMGATAIALTAASDAQTLVQASSDHAHVGTSSVAPAPVSLAPVDADGTPSTPPPVAAGQPTIEVPATSNAPSSPPPEQVHDAIRTRSSGNEAGGLALERRADASG
jgi:hypothetical protein